MQVNARVTYGRGCKGNVGECRGMPWENMRVGEKCQGNAGECMGMGAKCHGNAGEYQGNVSEWVQSARGMLENARGTYVSGCKVPGECKGIAGERMGLGVR